MAKDRCWNVLLHVKNDRDARWMVEAMERAGYIEFLWLARDCKDALRYLRGRGVYANRAAYPEPNLVIVNSTRKDALKVLQISDGLYEPPLVVQLTARPDVSQSLNVMRAGAACSQPKPRSRGETIAFVDWLQGWLASIAGTFEAHSYSILGRRNDFYRSDVGARFQARRGERSLSA